MRAAISDLPAGVGAVENSLRVPVTLNILQVDGSRALAELLGAAGQRTTVWVTELATDPRCVQLAAV